jgi:AraC-like DNA-binding protein
MLIRPTIGRLTLARLDREPLTTLVSGLDSCVGQVIRSGNEALRLLTVYLRDIDHRQGLTSPDVRRLVIAHIYDVLALVLNSSQKKQDFAERAAPARLREIKKYVIDKLGASDLTISDVASANGISPRQVQRLFELEGETFSEFVLTRRLHNVRTALLDSRQAHRSVSEIALANGFGDVSYFNRAFRRQFGASPSEVRRAALATI